MDLVSLMTIRAKMLAGYGLSFALIGIVLMWAIAHVISLGQASDAILRENYRSIVAATGMLEAIERQESMLVPLILEDADSGRKGFIEQEKHFLYLLGRAKDNITVEGEADLLAQIDQLYTAYREAFWDLQPGLDAENYRETILPAYQQVHDMCRNLRDLNEKTMQDASARASQIAVRAISSTLLVGALALLTGMGFAWRFSGLLVRPMMIMTEATRSLTEGHYEVCVPGTGSDELGVLARCFNSMAEKLRAYHVLNVERLLSEKRKGDAVLRSITDAIVVVDHEMRVASMNPSAAKILGVDPAHVEGRHFLEVVRHEGLFELVRRCAESGPITDLSEKDRIFSLGQGEQQRHYLLSVTPTHGSEGSKAGVVILLRDVTWLKTLDRMKSEFIMTASHELRTPLTSLEMSIRLLQESIPDKLTPNEQALLCAAGEEVQRLRELVDDLLDLSRMEAGKIQLQFGKVSVSMLVDKALAIFRSQAAERHITLNEDLPHDLPEVWADANKIAWVLTNLVSNALRYVPAEGRVHVAAECLGNWVHVSVADNGKGIPPDQQARIFDKFFQAQGDTSPGGSGLGLAICKEIVRAHRGSIWVHSNTGEGSVFTFTLPIASANEQGEWG